MSKLHIEVTYPYPVSTVWKAFTDPDQLKQWHMDNNFLPKVGHKFQFRGTANKHWNGILDCEVLEVIENKKLSYTSCGYDKESITTITYTFISLKKETKVILEHTGFKGLRGIVFSKIIVALGSQFLLRIQLTKFLNKEGRKN
jgi:uncharacterized protein YndB with AHSA1/START domain